MSCLPRPFRAAALPVFLWLAQSLQAFPFCSLKQAAARPAVDFRFYRLVQRARHPESGKWIQFKFSWLVTHKPEIQADDPLPKFIPKQTSSIAQSEALLQMRTSDARGS